MHTSTSLHPQGRCRAFGTASSSGSSARRHGNGGAATRGARGVAAAATGAPRQTTVHKLIEADGFLVVPGCYDALSAKLLADAGHKAAFVSGYAVSATLLGEPDVGLLTPPEMARKAGQIVSSLPPTLPVLVDADTGGGNVLNVQRTVRQLISVGAKGCFLEDQAWPKKVSGSRNRSVISMEDFAAKVSAAREAIHGADFFLVARTDARGVNAKYGLEDAITRANLYADAGADATYITQPISKQELSLIGQKVRGIKVMCNLEGGVTPLATPEEARAMGFQMLASPLTGVYAAAKALQRAYGALASGGTSRDLGEGALASYKEFNALLGMEACLAAEERLTRRPEGAEKLTVRVRAPTKVV